MHLVTTGKHNRGKECKQMLFGLTKWLKYHRLSDRCTERRRDRDEWMVMLT